MKHLNPTSTKIFAHLIKLMGTSGSLKIDVNKPDSGIMPVVLEKLYTASIGNITATIYSLAHYYVQNGDLVPDPDMEFMVRDTDPVGIFPMSFKDRSGIVRGIFKNENDDWVVNLQAQSDHTYFAHQWLKNIKWQQSLKL